MAYISQIDFKMHGPLGDEMAKAFSIRPHQKRLTDVGMALMWALVLVWASFSVPTSVVVKMKPLYLLRLNNK